MSPCLSSHIQLLPAFIFRSDAGSGKTREDVMGEPLRPFVERRKWGLASAASKILCVAISGTLDHFAIDDLEASFRDCSACRSGLLVGQYPAQRNYRATDPGPQLCDPPRQRQRRHQIRA